jgi:hypothetical protein
MQAELLKEMSVRKDLENRMAALEKQLPSKMEKAEDIHNQRRQMKKHQHAVTQKGHKNNRLMIHISSLSLDKNEK